MHSVGHLVLVIFTRFSHFLNKFIDRFTLTSQPVWKTQTEIFWDIQTVLERYAGTNREICKPSKSSKISSFYAKLYIVAWACKRRQMTTTGKFQKSENVIFSFHYFLTTFSHLELCLDSGGLWSLGCRWYDWRGWEVGGDVTGWGGDVGLLTLISRDFCFSSLNFMAISVMSFLYSVSNLLGSKYLDGLNLLLVLWFWMILFTGHFVGFAL